MKLKLQTKIRDIEGMLAADMRPAPLGTDVDENIYWHVYDLENCLRVYRVLHTDLILVLCEDQRVRTPSSSMLPAHLRCSLLIFDAPCSSPFILFFSPSLGQSTNELGSARPKL